MPYAFQGARYHLERAEHSLLLLKYGMGCSTAYLKCTRETPGTAA